jgi:transcriptional regulator with XRE-family HTH domain
MIACAIETAFYQRLGILLAAERRHRHLSQSELALILGVHRNTVMRWEKGECYVDALQLLRLADALSCNHLMLLPPKEFTWGAEGKKPVQSERELTKNAAGIG